MSFLNKVCTFESSNETVSDHTYERIERVNTGLKRYLYHNIDWNDRLIALLRARGSGKTTLLLQYARENRDLSKTLYLSLDHILFQNQPKDLDKKGKADGIELGIAAKIPIWLFGFLY